MLPWKKVEPSPAWFKRVKTLPHLNPLPLRKGEAGSPASLRLISYARPRAFASYPFWGEDEGEGNCFFA